jgi:hypothetical protein
MKPEARGEGERREAARRRWRYLVTGALFTVGLVIGLLIEEDAPSRSGWEWGWTPTTAVVVACVFLAAAGIGTIVYNRITDELERQRNYRAASLAGAVLLTGYPLWYILWKGGLAPEPMHTVLFFVFMASMIAASAWYRFRLG